MLFVVKIALKFNLRACNFQNFPGVACPQTPLALVVVLRTTIAS